MKFEKKLRVAMYTNVYRPTTNGVVTSVDFFRRGLNEIGHDVFLFAPGAGECEDIEPYIFRYLALKIPGRNYPLAVPVSRFADRLLPRLKPHVLHANHPALLGSVAAQKSKELNVPLVFTYHTRYREYAHYASFIPKELTQDFLLIWLANFMKDCHQIVVPSQSIKDLLREEHGVEEGVEVVSTGVDPTPFLACNREDSRARLGLKGDILVSSGRLAKEKNFPLLLEAFALIAPKRPEASLYILGDGDDREALRKLSVDLNIADRVFFPGLVPSAEIPLYLTAADLFFFASVTETQGLVTLEAMAAGLPVVAVNATGTADLVEHGKNGLLTSATPEALAEAALSLLENPEMRREFSVKAQARSLDFGLVTQARKMEKAYRCAMERHKAGKNINSRRKDPEHWRVVKEKLTAAFPLKVLAMSKARRKPSTT